MNPKTSKKKEEALYKSCKFLMSKKGREVVDKYIKDYFEQSECKCPCHTNPLNKTLGEVEYCSKCVRFHSEPKTSKECLVCEDAPEGYEHHHCPDLECPKRSHSTPQQDWVLEVKIELEKLEAVEAYKAKLLKAIKKYKKEPFDENVDYNLEIICDDIIDLIQEGDIQK